MNLTQSSLAEFAGDLAARTPVPGGGGASAYAGALAASLASMAAAFTRPKDESASDDVLDPIVERSRALSAELVSFVEKDAEAYLALSRAYGMSSSRSSRASARGCSSPTWASRDRLRPAPSSRQASPSWLTRSLRQTPRGPVPPSASATSSSASLPRAAAPPSSASPHA